MERRLFTAGEIVSFARRALLDEVYTTPKPGLVDCHDSGAHLDMDVAAFETSTEAVAPYIGEMYALGVESVAGLAGVKSPQALFSEIRAVGMQAERSMFRATDGVNTHKGIIFTLGIIAAATGRTLAAGRGGTERFGRLPVDAVLQTAQEMTYEALEADFSAMRSREPLTHGELLFARYGERGIRGEAQQGFPVIARTAYPALCELSAHGVPENERNILTLLRIISVLNDTNVLSRSSPDTLRWLKAQAHVIADGKTALAESDLARVSTLNEECIVRHVSPGGAADILAVSLFLLYTDSAILSL